MRSKAIKSNSRSKFREQVPNFAAIALVNTVLGKQGTMASHVPVAGGNKWTMLAEPTKKLVDDGKEGNQHANSYRAVVQSRTLGLTPIIEDMNELALSSVKKPMANLRPGADDPGIGFDFENESERHRLSHPAKLASSAEQPK